MRRILIMRRIYVLGMLSLALLLTLVACGGSPKSLAADWADRFPAEFNEWELDEDRIELTAENQSNKGHITLTYENDDEVLVYISIDVYATETAADVELSARMRDWQLQGLRFERIRPAGYDVTMTAGGYLAYLQEEDTLFTLSIIPPMPETENSTDADADTETSTDETASTLVAEETIETFQELIAAVVSNK